jgi:hypothetical protein
MMHYLCRLIFFNPEIGNVRFIGSGKVRAALQWFPGKPSGHIAMFVGGILMAAEELYLLDLGAIISECGEQDRQDWVNQTSQTSRRPQHAIAHAHVFFGNSGT